MSRLFGHDCIIFSNIVNQRAEERRSPEEGPRAAESFLKGASGRQNSPAGCLKLNLLKTGRERRVFCREMPPRSLRGRRERDSKRPGSLSGGRCRNGQIRDLEEHRQKEKTGTGKSSQTQIRSVSEREKARASGCRKRQPLKHS